MRRLDEKRFLVRFPPGKKIKDLVSFPSINLKKKGVSMSFMDWNGDIPAYSKMEEIWVKVEGIPPKYLSWRVMMRVATALGIPIDVDIGKEDDLPNNGGKKTMETEQNLKTPGTAPHSGRGGMVRGKPVLVVVSLPCVQVKKVKRTG
jgi:hypothetical protein